MVQEPEPTIGITVAHDVTFSLVPLEARDFSRVRLHIDLFGMIPSDKKDFIQLAKYDELEDEDAELEWKASETHDGTHSCCLYAPASTKLFSEYMAKTDKVDFAIKATMACYGGVYAFEKGKT